MLTESLRNATGCAEKSPKALLNAAKCPQIRSDSKQNSGRRWICRPRGARVTETANLFGVKFSQRFRAYEEGFRGGSVCCCAERGRGKPRAKEGSPTKRDGDCTYGLFCCLHALHFIAVPPFLSHINAMSSLSAWTDAFPCHSRDCMRLSTLGPRT